MPVCPRKWAESRVAAITCPFFSFSWTRFWNMSIPWTYFSDVSNPTAIRIGSGPIARQGSNPTATRLRPPAQGCRLAATLGGGSTTVHHQPPRGCGPGLCVAARDGRNPFRVDGAVAALDRVSEHDMAATRSGLTVWVGIRFPG